jgi:uroporphyrinogen III methyltransferase / synthase
MTRTAEPVAHLWPAFPPYPVALVGAGPGHPGLITLRAVECLAQADLVVYDQLASPRLLDYAPASARRLCVNALHEKHPERAPLVNQALIDAARQGLRVVRLKGGDPFLFGRGGEEAEALRQAGLPFEIVPGVTAALGASACAGIPLTHRLESSAVALVTGHEKPGKCDPLLDWNALARFPGTLVVYMGLLRLPTIVQALVDQGKDPATPAAAIEQGSTNQQRTVTAPLIQLPDAVRTAGLRSPTLIVIGAVVAFRERLAWFEHRPLFAKHVLVTRPRDQVASLVHALEELGAIVTALPTVEIHELADYSTLDQAIARLHLYQWLVFTSVNGVSAFMRRLRQQGRDLRALGSLKLAAIGPATAEALRAYWLEPDLVPDEYRAESLAAALREKVRDQRVLLARADRGREVLRDLLSEVAEVDQAPVYRQIDAGEGSPLDMHPTVREQLRGGPIEFVTLTSANIARSLLRGLDDATRKRVVEGELKLVSISPVTSAAIVEMGLPVAAEAREYTMKGVVEALLRLDGNNNKTATSAQIAKGVPGQVED